MFHLKKYLRRIGPGVITGASDDDPSGIMTYSQTGAQFGYGFLWLAWFTTPLMMAVQEISARLGLVTRQGLAKIISQHISRRVALWLSLGLLVANVVNIGADLSAMAAVAQLVIPGPLALYIILFAGIIISLEVLVTYARYANILKWLTLALFAYVITAFVTKQDWGSIIHATIIPNIPSGGAVWILITGILGTTISPYLFFWQAAEEVEEENLAIKVNHRAHPKMGAWLRRMRWDTVVGMLYSNLIMFFIIVVTAGTLHQAGITTIISAAQAADALRPLAGSLTFGLFALGVIGTGLLAVPILAGSAAYALAEVFNWSEGLSKRFNQARGFYLIIAAAIVVGALMTASGISPIRFLIMAAVINGLLAPIIIWYMLRLADRPEVVGDHRSPPVVRIVAWGTLIIMTGSGILTIIHLIS